MLVYNCPKGNDGLAFVTGNSNENQLYYTIVYNWSHENLLQFVKHKQNPKCNFLNFCGRVGLSKAPWKKQETNFRQKKKSQSRQGGWVRGSKRLRNQGKKGRLGEEFIRNVSRKNMRHVWTFPAHRFTLGQGIQSYPFMGTRRRYGYICLGNSWPS